MNFLLSNGAYLEANNIPGFVGSVVLLLIFSLVKFVGLVVIFVVIENWIGNQELDWSYVIGLIWNRN